MEDRWSHISKKCFHFIAKRLELVDLIRVSCVCQTWNSLAASLLPPKLNPWLIVPYGGYKSREGTVWDDNLGFFNLSNNTVYKVRMPEIVDRRICGSCRGGWLITLHENGEIQLLHPFSKDVIDLPPITTLHGVAGSFIDDDNDLVYDIPTGYGEEYHRNNIISTCIREFYIFKAIMSSHNSRTGIVMAIHGLSRHLAFCRPGKDKIWSSLKGDVDGRFTDITYYEGKFYAVQNGGSVFVVDGLDTSFPSVKLVLASPTDYSLDKYYLIESLGELLWISRTRYIPGGGFDYFEEDPLSYKTSDFRVKKLVVDVPKWVDVSDLGNDRALFVGYNDSFSLSTSDLPGCKGNSIYFTDDNLEEYTDQPFGGHDIGVFHLKYGYVDECYPIDSKLIKPPPVWFTTSTITSVSDCWLHLPDHLYHSITKRLELVDLIRFSCVCQTWKSLTTSLLPPKLNPWLIVPYGGYKSREGTVWDDNLGFFNLSNQIVYKVRMPEIADRRICGSCRGGWLITLHENGEIQLLHPFSKDVIDLPPITTLPGVAGSFIDDDNDLVYDIPTGYGKEDHRNNIISTCIREFYIFKAMISSHNSTTGIVMAIHGLSRHLAFCRPGKDQIWSSLKGDVDGRFTDITFYKGKFYAVQNGGSVFVVDGLDTSFPFVKLVLDSPTDYSLDKYYLIESLGELLWISRTRYIPGGGFDYFEEDPPSYKTSDFRVKKLVVDVPKWVDVSDLGNDRALFVGYNDSFSLSTSDFPGCKGNSIYFTDDNLEEYTDQPFGGHDIGVFHLKYGYVDECYPIDSKLIKPPPVWFTTKSC